MNLPNLSFPIGSNLYTAVLEYLQEGEIDDDVLSVMAFADQAMADLGIKDRELWGDKLLRLAIRILNSEHVNDKIMEVDCELKEDKILMDLYNRFADIFEESNGF